MKRFMTVAACAIFFVGVTACTQEAEGPAEQAGKQIDEAVEETKAEVGEAAEEAAEQVEEAAEKVRASTQQ